VISVAIISNAFIADLLLHQFCTILLGLSYI
jgi:hypothetical protein